MHKDTEQIHNILKTNTLPHHTDGGKEPEISYSDIARQKNSAEPKDVVKNWMRQKNTLEYLGLWERLHNPNFKGVEFDPLLTDSTRGQECCALGVLCVNYDKISLECDALKQAILRQVFE